MSLLGGRKGGGQERKRVKHLRRCVAGSLWGGGKRSLVGVKSKMREIRISYLGFV